MADIIGDTEAIIQEALGKKRILLEGAQGLLLSIDHGTYPFVTSADCSLNGLARNAGVEKSDLAFTLAVTKAPYMTRVGHGPF
ncbi:MAG: adenylosuccinate synthetase, partial [Candidatus Liptonbacteria bacterium]|nr:adenylosuccinate synthetase [Candidatus Liptonbacteria bacterium]